MRNVYIMGGLRTPIGLFQGQFKNIRPEFLGAAVLRELQDKYTLPLVDEIICGNAVGTGGNIGRLMALSAGLPPSVPTVTVDMQCASAGASIAFGMAKIACGMAGCIIAGGIESSSLQPMRRYAELDDRQGEYMVAHFSPEERDEKAMLLGAERTMAKHGMTAEDINSWVLRSHQRAHEAEQQGLLKPILAKLSDLGEGFCDESIRPKMSERLLRRMPPLLGEGTLTTAGNACLTHDGAAFVVLTSVPSEFRLVHAVSWAGDPLYSPEGALGATEKLLKETKLTMADIDAVEWNEAFAAIDVLFERNYGAYVDRYNRFGGALAYGHPYGASGAIILLHLMESLKACSGRYGIAAVAGAGGTGTAMLIERMESHHE